MGLWGIKKVVFTNAAGAIAPALKPGDLMLIDDHINLTGKSPLTGHNDDRLGTRFPDMSVAYDRDILEMFKSSAQEQGITVGQAFTSA